MHLNTLHFFPILLSLHIYLRLVVHIKCAVIESYVPQANNTGHIVSLFDTNTTSGSGRIIPSYRKPNSKSYSRILETYESYSQNKSSPKTETSTLKSLAPKSTLAITKKAHKGNSGNTKARRVQDMQVYTTYITSRSSSP